jgi:hypothetical protein
MNSMKRRLLADGTRFVVIGLRGDDARQAARQEPLVQAVDLAALESQVGQQGEYDVQGVEHDALRPHLAALRIERREHPAQVEIPRLHGIGRRLGIQDEELPAPPQCAEIPAEALRIGFDARGGLLEGHENTRLTAMRGAMHEELQRENGLAGSRPAHDQRRASHRQTSAGGFVEPDDACGRLQRSLGRFAAAKGALRFHLAA